MELSSKPIFFITLSPISIIPRVLTSSSAGCSLTLSVRNHTPFIHRRVRTLSNWQSLSLSSTDDQFDDKNSRFSDIKTEILSLQGQLKLALKAEDYRLAAEIRDKITSLEKSNPNTSLDTAFLNNDWKSLGIPSWLILRLTQCGYAKPTQIQSQSLLKCVSNTTFQDVRDGIILSHTDSGKSLALILPMLTQFNEELCAQSMQFRSNESSQNRYPALILIVTATSESALSHKKLLQSLLGSVSSSDQSLRNSESSTRRSSRSFSSFSASSRDEILPKGIRVESICNSEDVERAVSGSLLDGVHIVVGVASQLSKVIQQLVIVPSRLKGIIVDDFDLCLEMNSDSVMRKILSTSYESTTWKLVSGSNITEEFVRRVLLFKWITNPVIITRLESFEDPQEIIKDSRLSKSLIHRVLTVNTQYKSLKLLCDMLLRDSSIKSRENGNHGSILRVIVFVNSVDSAEKVDEALKEVTWNDVQRKTAVFLLNEDGNGEDSNRKVLDWFEEGIINTLVVPIEFSEELMINLGPKCCEFVYSMFVPVSCEDYLFYASFGKSLVTQVNLEGAEREKYDEVVKKLGISEICQDLETNSYEIPDSVDKESILKFLDSLYQMENSDENSK
eukprot:CAMPEP_0182444488 /NCGR_PEP_ID=MMETSP1172-20130603/2924_1 /TAXON_ID=708627 /ORGANISM="Timspurckia oligopyrenoides, Strain CCMP3278" /LENGTH=616 /DNA_ID=CAMNT_0024640053 /DNA_START=133 /DNA_END=1983 /DNA_ORIENTATION=+